MSSSRWPTARIGEVCLLNPRRSKIECKADSPTSFIQMSSVDDLLGIIKTIEIRPYAEIAKGYTYFEENDVIFAKITPCMQNGKHAIARGLVDGFGFGSTEFHVLRPTERILPDWLHFFVRQPSFLWKAQQTFAGAVGQQRVPEIFLAETEIPIPDLPTQRRITARLKEQLNEIEHARQAAEGQTHTSGKLLEKFLVVAFHGICPLSLGINQSNAPNGWAWKKLPSLARLESGHTPSRRCPEYWANGDVPWLALPDIRALDCRVANVTSESTNELGLANSSARLLPKDTVALSRTASVGFITIFGRPMATSQDFVNWICGGDLHPKFLLWLLRAARKFILDQSTGAIHKTVYMDVVERFHVCIPNLAEQQNIAAKLDAIFEEVVSLRAAGTAQLAALQKLPAAFLREAFGGLS